MRLLWLTFIIISDQARKEHLELALLGLRSRAAVELSNLSSRLFRSTECS